MKPSIKTYVWLLAVNLFISAFTFGGGYVVVPMVRRFFVEKKQYFTEEELIDMAAIAQSTPGAIAINLSALAGYKATGQNECCVEIIEYIPQNRLIEYRRRLRNYSFNPRTGGRKKRLDK